MASELDLDFLQIMREIEARRARPGDLAPSVPVHVSKPRRARSRLRTCLVVVVALVSLAALLYLAYLSGLFGTVKGEKAPWRRAYRDKADQYDRLWALYRNRTELLNKTRDEADAWKAKAESCSEDLVRCSSELELSAKRSAEWESKYWRTEFVLNLTVSQKEALEMELDNARNESEDWKWKYFATKSSLDCLQIMYAGLKDDLEELKRRFNETAADREILEKELMNRTIEIIRLTCLLEVSSSDLRQMTSERDAWVVRFRELETSYNDLLCELKMSRALVERYKGLYEEEVRRLEQALREMEECRSRCERLAAALNKSNLDYRELRSLYDRLAADLETMTADLDRWRTAYQALHLRYNASVEDARYWRSMYENLSAVLARVRSERDAWILLYQTVNVHLSECQSEVNYWRTLYLARQSELDDALAEAARWKALYQGLANISLRLEIANVTVISRSCGKPSVVSADVKVCVSTKDTPMFMFLEYWAEPLDCIYGYGSILEDISSWPANCKTFRVTMSFGKGISSYKIVARASLRPIHGYDEIWQVGPP